HDLSSARTNTAGAAATRAWPRSWRTARGDGASACNGAASYGHAAAWQWKRRQWQRQRQRARTGRTEERKRTMSIKRSFVAFAVLLLIAGGCKQRQQTASTSASSNNQSVAQAAATPEQLGELGAKIKRQPNDAHRLLQENG